MNTNCEKDNDCKNCSVMYEFSNLYRLDGQWSEEDIVALLEKLRRHSTIKGEGTFISAIIDMINTKNSMIRILKMRCDNYVNIFKNLGCICDD